MARKPAPGTHDRILETAARLFHDHGVRGVGLQQVIDECGCGKNLLYREFPSKDELVVAYLDRCARDWQATIDQAIAPHEGDPAGQLVAIVRATADQVTAPDYRGCPFQNIHAEFPDPAHPAHRLAVDHRAEVRALIHDLAERAQARNPDALTDRIMLIVDGMYAHAAFFGGQAAAPYGVALVEEVVRAATEPRAM